MMDHQPQDYQSRLGAKWGEDMNVVFHQHPGIDETLPLHDLAA
jgi:hypothetical protein